MSLAGNDWLWLAWTQMWQVTVLIVAVALLTRLAAANRPQLAFVLWLVVLLKCVTPPLWGSPAGAFCWMQPTQTTAIRHSQGELAVALLPAGSVAGSSRDDSGSPQIDSDAETSCWNLELPRLIALLAVIWGVGVIAVLAAIVVQRRCIAKLVRRADAAASVPYADVLARLARRLKIKRRVRLVVTESSVGPAVLGPTRPTVLLPMAVTDGKSADEIELILAHELMHIRGGDLWFALLRSLVQAIWWFHPLVWWAGRRASREAERCCDDAVLAELHCNPARYARCLLDILEIKHRLSYVPAFPGVRAIEVNQGRLERIMKIGHGGYRRTPAWCWGVAVLAIIAVLPGAAMRTSADEGAYGRQQATSPGLLEPPSSESATSSIDSQPGPGLSPIDARTAGGEELPLIAKVYSTKDVLLRIQGESGLSRAMAQKDLAWALTQGMLSGRVPDGPALCRDQSQANISFPTKPTNRLVWAEDGERMVLNATEAEHQRVTDMLKAIAKSGLVQIAIETRFVVVPAKEIDQIVPDFTTSPLAVVGMPMLSRDTVQPASFVRPLDIDEGAHVTRAQLLIEKNSPVQLRLVDEEQGAKLIDRCQANEQANVLQAPKVTVFNGQTAFVSDTSQSAFVTGAQEVGLFAKAFRPQIRVVTEGTTLQLRPVVDASGAVHLDFAVTMSNIQNVGTLTTTGSSGNPISVQTPEVATTRMEGGAVLKRGQWLLFRPLDAKDQTAKNEVTAVSWTDWLLGRENPPKHDEPRTLILMLRAETLRPSH